MADEANSPALKQLIARLEAVAARLVLTRARMRAAVGETPNMIPAEAPQTQIGLDATLADADRLMAVIERDSAVIAAQVAALPTAV